MGRFDYDAMGSVMGGIGAVVAEIFSAGLAMIVGIIYGLIIAGTYEGFPLIATASWMIAFFPFLMWLDMRCVPVGVLYVYLFYCYWWKRRRLSSWFLLCGVSAFYSYVLCDTSLWPIVLFWIVLVAVWAGIRVYLKWNYQALERMHAKDMYSEEERIRPPVSQGICQQCGRYFERIYYLPDGSRVCEACYKPAEDSMQSEKA